MAEDLTTPLLSDSEVTAEAPALKTSPTVAILGSGDFSRSLAVRLVACGVRVVVGSRCVNRIPLGQFPDAVELRNQEGAVSQTGCLVFMALFPEHYHSLVGLQSALAGKVLVDVSNAADMNNHGPSNAEQLAELFPDSLVVKGFNTVSAWELQTGAHDGNRQVRGCCCANLYLWKTSVRLFELFELLLFTTVGPDLQ